MQKQYGRVYLKLESDLALHDQCGEQDMVKALVSVGEDRKHGFWKRRRCVERWGDERRQLDG